MSTFLMGNANHLQQNEKLPLNLSQHVPIHV